MIWKAPDESIPDESKEAEEELLSKVGLKAEKSSIISRNRQHRSMIALTGLHTFQSNLAQILLWLEEKDPLPANFKFPKAAPEETVSDCCNRLLLQLSQAERVSKCQGYPPPPPSASASRFPGKFPTGVGRKGTGLDWTGLL